MSGRHLAPTLTRMVAGGDVESRRTRSSVLTLDEIVEVAGRLVQDVGVERLTMRAMADELGVTPMAIYHYVANREQLVETLGARVLAEAMPALDDGSRWENVLRARAHATFHALAAYPGLGAFLLERPAGARSRASQRREVEMLHAAGLSERDAELAQASFHTYMFGLIGLETRFRPLKRRATRNRQPEAILVDVDVDEFIDFGVDLIIDGIHRRLGQ